MTILEKLSLWARAAAVVTTVAVFGAGSAFAQSTASITGRVTDPSGAAVPGAQVSAHSVATGLTRKTTSNSIGLYTLGSLPVGTYILKGESEGFKQKVQTGITLQVNETATLNLSLEVGSTTDTVTVEEAMTKVDTESGTLREVVDSTRITELPLNGRNALQLQALLPGVVQGSGPEQFGGTPGYQINGSTSVSNNYILDGGGFIDPYFNAPQSLPNPDALQEFTIQTSASSAEYGRNRGGTIVAVTKSGTNEFHGGAYEFLRNNHLNARNWFAKTVSPFHRNQYGVYLGGPAIRNKLFYFGSWEATRESGSPGVSSVTVLSDAERQGDFSGLGKVIRDPLNQQPFAGSKIPASRLNPVAQKFLSAYIPLPNAPNRVFTKSRKPGSSIDQYVGKIDWNRSDKDLLSARWLNTDQNVICDAVLEGFCRGGVYPRKSFVASYTRTVSPTDVNTFTLTWGRTHPNFYPKAKFFWKDLGANIPADETGYVHTIAVGGRFTADTGSVKIIQSDTFQFADSYSFIRGAHILKVGADYSRQLTDQSNPYLTGGNARFTGALSGDGGSDFVLGRMVSFQQISPLSNALRQNELAAYAQDQWKVLPGLTLSLGLRWDPSLLFTDTQNRLSAYRSGMQSRVYPTALPGMAFPGDPGIPPTIAGNEWGQFAPRFGFAWSPSSSNRLAFRGGYGIYHDHLYSMTLNRFPLTQPFVLDVTVYDVDLLDPFQGKSPFPYALPKTPEEAKALQFVKQAGFTSLSPSFTAPRTQQWNFNIQWEPVKSYVITTAYVGSKTSHSFFSRNINPAIPNPAATVANTQSRRPLADFGVLEEETTDGYSQYHSLQLTLNKRLTNSFTLLSSYTFSKNTGLTVAQAEGTQGPRHPFNYSLDKGRLAYDVRHTWVSSGVWTLPLLRNSPGVLRWPLGGWEFNAIVALQSGSPFTVRSGVDNSLFGINGDTADLVGDPLLDSGRPRAEQVAQYFNTAAFKPNAKFTVGTAGINILDGPGNISTSLALNKNFPIRERAAIQFRAEAFNATNRVNLGGPTATQNSPNFGRILGAGDPRVIQLALKLKF